MKIPTVVTPHRALAAMILFVFGFSTWSYMNINNQINHTNKLLAETQQAASAKHKVLQDTVVKSGKGGFEVTIPSGWGPISNDMSADYMTISGTQQPKMDFSGVQVLKFAGHGDDAQHMFTIRIGDDVGNLEGTPTDVSFGKAEDAVQGKKYTKIYTEDTEVGIGYLRPAGDRDYHYVFKKNGKTLHVFYSVYANDPRNFINTVDGIVQSIRFL